MTKAGAKERKAKKIQDLNFPSRHLFLLNGNFGTTASFRLSFFLLKFLSSFLVLRPTTPCALLWSACVCREIKWMRKGKLSHVRFLWRWKKGKCKKVKVKNERKNYHLLRYFLSTTWGNIFPPSSMKEREKKRERSTWVTHIHNHKKFLNLFYGEPIRCVVRCSEAINFFSMDFTAYLLISFTQFTGRGFGAVLLKVLSPFFCFLASIEFRSASNRVILGPLCWGFSRQSTGNHR